MYQSLNKNTQGLAHTLKTTLAPSILCPVHARYQLVYKRLKSLILIVLVAMQIAAVVVRQLSALLMPRLELPLIILMTWICLHFY